jgi:hypothetical protein
MNASKNVVKAGIFGMNVFSVGQLGSWTVGQLVFIFSEILCLCAFVAI